MRLRLSNQQGEVRVRVRPLQRQLNRALEHLPRPLPAGIAQVEVILVDRATMGRVHAEFLGDASETDVITFPYGEILVCPAVAEEQAVESGLPVDQEVLLYGLHGLLHLAGLDDVTSMQAKVMGEAQADLLRRVLK